jgi:sulfatase-like protein
VNGDEIHMGINANLSITELPDPPSGARNLMLIVLDSLRYDSWIAASPKNLSRLGDVEKRYSYAPWTAPSHHSMLMTLLPHIKMPADMTASEYYYSEALKFWDRMGIAGEIASEVTPALFLPTYVRSIGYQTRALASMSVLNPRTVINRDFESYEMISRNQVDQIVDRLHFDANRPTFYMINIGLTHYPYTLPGEDNSQYPNLFGLNGAVEALRGNRSDHINETPRLLSRAEMAAAKERQIRSLSYMDDIFGRLFEKLPKNTYLIVTSDHGELFGEDGLFGHGPYTHEKVFEVPLVEGMVPRG